MLSYQREEVVLARDVDAIQIPDGTRARLAAGMRVLITQSLGGSYTIMTERGAMYRVDDKNADALGKQLPGVNPEEASGTVEERVWGRMKKCFDPEIPVNIVDLGLVYDCQLTPAEEGRYRVDVKMTLTAPGCGMGDVLAQDVKTKIQDVPEVSEAHVEVVFDPPWSQSMMTDVARLQLGMW